MSFIVYHFSFSTSTGLMSVQQRKMIQTQTTKDPIRRFCSLCSRATFLSPTGKRHLPVPVVPSDSESGGPNIIHEEEQESLHDMILDFEATLTE